MLSPRPGGTLSRNEVVPKCRSLSSSVTEVTDAVHCGHRSTSLNTAKTCSGGGCSCGVAGGENSAGAALVLETDQNIARRLPAYTIANIDDIYGRIVAYERLLMPFSGGGNVTHIIASLKTISEDGGFEIKNLMRGNDQLPVPKLRTIIDRDLFHRAPGRIPSGDVLEFG